MEVRKLPTCSPEQIGDAKEIFSVRADGAEGSDATKVAKGVLAASSAGKAEELCGRAEALSQQQPLETAIQAKDDAAVLAAIAGGADVNQMLPNGAYPLEYACENSTEGVVSQILLSGAKVEPRAEGELTPLHLACRRGDPNMVRVLFGAGANPNVLGPGGSTPLHEVALGNHADCVACFVPPGGDFQVQDSEGRTPLHIAGGLGHTGTCVQFLERNARTDVLDCRGQSPLHHMAKDGRADLMDTLLKGYALVRNMINHQDRDGKTPLHLACENGHTAAALTLYIHGANSVIPDGAGSLPPQSAGRHVDTAVALIGAMREGERTRPFHWACEHRQYDLLVNLLQSRGNEQICSMEKDDDGKTAMHVASGAGELEFVKKLLVGQLELLNKPDNEGRTPLYDACVGGHDKVYDYLQKQGASPSDTLVQACRLDDSNVIAYLLEKGASTERALEYAVKEGKVEAVIQFMNKSDPTRGYPLHSAASKDQVEVAAAILENVNDSDAMREERDVNGLRPLDRAVIAGQRKMAFFLVQDGSPVTEDLLKKGLENGQAALAEELIEHCAKGAGFSSPFRWAVENERLEALAVLAIQGRDLNQLDEQGFAPIHYAVAGNSLPVAEFLLESGADVAIIGPEARSLMSYVISREMGHLLAERGAEMSGADFLYAASLELAMWYMEDRRIDMATRDEKGRTALHYPCSPELTRELIRRGLAVDAVDVNRRTPFMFAIFRGDWEQAEALHGANADVHHKANRGLTALHLVCKEVHAEEQAYEAYKRLLEMGADPMQLDEEGKVALQHCQKEGLVKSIIKLMEGRNWYPLNIAYAMTGGTEPVAGLSLLAFFEGQGAEWNPNGGREKTLLLEAIADGRMDAFEYKMARPKSEVEASTELDQGVGPLQLTPLHVAAHKGRLEMVQKLVELNALLDAPGAEGGTPLMWAAASGHGDVVEHLLKEGADVNCTDNKGNTAVHWLCGSLGQCAIPEDKRVEVLELLIERGADVNAINEEGSRAADLAYYNKKGKVAKFLSGRGAKCKNWGSWWNSGMPAAGRVRNEEQGIN